MQELSDIEAKGLMLDVIMAHGCSLTIAVGDQEITISRDKVGEAWIEDGRPFAEALGAVCAALAVKGKLTLNGVEMDAAKPAMIVDADKVH